MERRIRAIPRAKNAHFGFIRRFAWFQNVGLNLEESQTSPGAFMGVRLCPDPDSLS
jgi:hypothetical protein